MNSQTQLKMKFQLFYLPEVLEPELWIINLN